MCYTSSRHNTESVYWDIISFYWHLQLIILTVRPIILLLLPHTPSCSSTLCSTLQSHWEVNRTTVRRLLFQSVIHCRHGCCSARWGSPHAAWGSVVPRPGCLSTWALRRLWRSTATTRLPPAHARAYSVCGSHHRQGGPYHQERHQTDTVQVS